MAKENKYAAIMQQLQLRQFAPIYVLMGEEAYYIDKICNWIESNAMPEDEREWNQVTHYGREADIETVINEARCYPTVPGRRVIFLKEAQSMQRKDSLSKLESYLQRPMESTVLVITYKYGKIDGRSKWMKLAEKLGVVYEAVKPYESALPQFIQELCTAKKVSIDRAAMEMLVEYVGVDLLQLEQIVDRLSILVGEKGKITLDIVKSSTAISRDYKPYELTDRICKRDVAGANRLILNSSLSIQELVATLFKYFENLIIYQYMPDKSRPVAAGKLGLSEFQLRNYEEGARNYTKMQVFKAIGYLREYDCQSKGLGGITTDSTELMKELVYKIMH
ncbi:MAG: DNA polymerase III subunit delta [Paludibacteraceae bacterium]|nr:DNA polymerase III subunit delta [Paludibacteraceae bacterium]